MNKEIHFNEELLTCPSKKKDNYYYIGRRSICGNYFIVWGEGVTKEEASASCKKQIELDKPICLMVERTELM